MTPNEERLLARLNAASPMEDLKVERRSDREYDLALKGRYSKSNKYLPGCAFSAWLPLAAINDLTVWPSAEIASLTDYPEMVMEGDWSGVRDSDPDKIWFIFERFVV
jgi:hypothetical protein